MLSTQTTWVNRWVVEWIYGRHSNSWPDRDLIPTWPLLPKNIVRMYSQMLQWAVTKKVQTNHSMDILKSKHVIYWGILSKISLKVKISHCERISFFFCPRHLSWFTGLRDWTVALAVTLGCTEFLMTGPEGIWFVGGGLILSVAKGCKYKPILFCNRSFDIFTAILQWLQHLAILSLSLTWTNPHWKYSWQTLQTSWCAAKEVQFELNRLNGWRGETVKQHFYKVEDNIDIEVIMMCWNAKLWIWDTKTHRDMQRTTCVLPITKVRCLHTHTSIL